MSSTNRGAVREKNDFYETPAVAARPAMLELEQMLAGCGEVSFIDAGAGMGALTREARAVFGSRAHIAGVEAFPQDMPLHRAVSMFEAQKHAELLAAGKDDYQARLLAAGADLVFTEDFTGFGFSKIADVVIANPPFSAALEFLRHTIEYLEPSIAAFLLRLNVLGGLDERQDWLEQYPPRAIRVLRDRPDFTGNGGDSIEYAWFFWGPGIPEGTPPIGWYR
ncbi:MAG: hypothetical protein WC273_00400 [Dehalococcoidia bacterium]